MEYSTGANIAVGASNQTTTFNILCGWHLAASAATTLSIRETSGAGTIIAQRVFAAAGQWDVDLGHPMKCHGADTVKFFVENTAGNITGGVYGINNA